jgi:hypothetical protein
MSGFVVTTTSAVALGRSAEAARKPWTRALEDLQQLPWIRPMTRHAENPNEDQ